MKTEHGEVYSVTIIGRRWFQRGPGNTYHTAQVLVNGRTVHKSEKQYGYGDQYRQTGEDWLEQNGYMPNRNRNARNMGAPGWQYFRDDNGVWFEAFSIDVPRERDL